MRFPLISAGYTGFTSQWNSSRNVNFFIARDVPGSKAELALLGTPGTILQYNVGSQPIRGMRPFGNVLYVVSGNQLYSITASGTITAISGATLLTSIGPVVMKDNCLQVSGTGGNQLMIVDGAAAYIYNVSSGLWTPNSSFTGGGFPSVGPIALEYIDGYFAIGVAGSQAVYSSDLYNGINYNTAAVAFAQAASDTVQALINMQEQLIVIKQWTTEFWYNAGVATSAGLPFQRQSNAVIDYGTPAPDSVSRGAGNIFMLGSRRTSNGWNFIGAVQITQDNPTVISPPAITKQMEAWSPWYDVIGFCYEQDGHSFWQVTSPSANQTFMYDASIGDPMLAWHERSTYISGSFYGTNRHVANSYAFFNGMHLIGDWSNGNIYQLTGNAYQDNGKPLCAFRTAQPIFDGKTALKSVNFHRLTIDAQVGVGGNIAYSWSDDGGSKWSGDYVHSLRVIGDYRGIDPWMPIGQHPYGFIPRVAISDNCPRTILGGYLE